ncbi:MAG: glycosyltransferase family 39 protein [Salinivirgaceae bacterium]|nr:glycosyltransferase family 39 protein [Salinivirgaceae bacterium]
MKTKSIFLFIIFILITFYLFHKESINKFPSNIHAWAQSDRYALAIGFINNNFDFFHPQTFNLTESPDNKLVAKTTSITSVDFPIHDYLVAIIMKIFNTKATWCFRLYTLIYSLIGLFVLFKISLTLQKNVLIAFSSILFFGLSPVFLYYQVSFIPTIPSLSNFIIAMFFFLKYKRSNKNTHYIVSISFMTLAALARTPFFIFLFALFLSELFQRRKINLQYILYFSVSFLFVIFYFIYNKYLSTHYTSSFLGNILPPNNFHHFIEIIHKSWNTWAFHYFTLYHYLFLFILGTFAVANIIKRKVFNELINNELFIFFLFSFLGAIMYAFLMLRQYINHDYYFLDSFFPPIIILYFLIIQYLPKKTKSISVILYAIIFVFFVFAIQNAFKTHKKRLITGSWDKVAQTTLAYNNSESFLNQNHISKKSKILALSSYTSNIPFILMNRYGFAMMSNKKDDIIKSLTWDFDYITVANQFLMSDVINEYPYFINRVNKVASNQGITIYQLSDSVIKRSLMQFLGFDDKNPSFKASIDFETINSALWQNTFRTATPKPIGNFSGYVDSTINFGITLKGDVKNYLNRDGKFILIEFSLYSQTPIPNSLLTISINKSGEGIVYQTYDLNTYLKKQDDWNKVTILYHNTSVDFNIII